MYAQIDSLIKEKEEVENKYKQLLENTIKNHTKEKKLLLDKIIQLNVQILNLQKELNKVKNQNSTLSNKVNQLDIVIIK